MGRSVSERVGAWLKKKWARVAFSCYRWGGVAGRGWSPSRAPHGVLRSPVAGCCFPAELFNLSIHSSFRNLVMVPLRCLLYLSYVLSCFQLPYSKKKKNISIIGF